MWIYLKKISFLNMTIYKNLTWGDHEIFMNMFLLSVVFKIKLINIYFDINISNCWNLFKGVNQLKRNLFNIKIE